MSQLYLWAFWLLTDRPSKRWMDKTVGDSTHPSQHVVDGKNRNRVVVHPAPERNKLMPQRLLSFAIVIIMATPVFAQENRRATYPPKMEGARVEVYKTIGDVKLNLYMFMPDGHKPTDKAPAIVFFFGGGWRGGNPAQFQKHCEYLASRGMVAMTADYRVLSRHGTKAVTCVADGKSAIRWVRANATWLGIDPDRIAAGGGSAGGHVAACTGVISGFDETGEDTAISSVPNAMVLFNPATVLAPVDHEVVPDERRLVELRERMGVDPKELSPYHHVKPGAPPTIIFHGTGDTTVPYKTVELFTKAMTKAGNQCKLVGFENRRHGFFNYGRGDGKDFVECVRQMDKFLAEQGFLDGKPTVK